MLPRVTLLALIALLCSSCGFKHEPTGVLAAYPQTVHDSQGRAVHIDTAPHRIVSLDPGMTAAMYSLGAEKLLVGRSGKETYPAKAQKVPVVAANGQPDMRAIRKANPDVILVPQSMVPTAADVNKLQLKAAALVYVVGGNSVAQVEDDIAQLGLITGHADEARALTNSIADQVTKVRSAVAGEPAARTYVDIGFVSGSTFTIDPQSMTGDLVRLANGDNVASEVTPTEAVTFDQLASLSPDVYLSETGQGATEADLKQNKTTAKLPAVTQHRVVQLPGSVLNEDGPRVARALAQIAKALHPDATIPQ